MYIIEWTEPKKQIVAESIDELSDNVKHVLEICPELKTLQFTLLEDGRAASARDRTQISKTILFGKK